MMPSRAIAVLIVSVVSLSVAWAAPGTRQPGPPAPATSPQDVKAPQSATSAAPSIKHLGVFGPVPGGKETAGLVKLVSPSRDRLGTSVYLSSNRPDLAAVPAGVVVPLNTTDATFKVTTSAVAAPTPVTITACSRPCGQAGAETKTATVVVRPPMLSSLACTPQQVPLGTQTTCTVWLDGKVAADTFVLTSSAEYAGSMIPYIKVPAGNVKGSRLLLGMNASSQPRPVTVNASYGGATRSTTLTVGPAYLKAIYERPISRAAAVWMQVDLLAPAAGQGVPYLVEVPSLDGRTDDKIPPGALTKNTFVSVRPVDVDTPVQVKVTTTFEAKDTKVATATVRAARLDRLVASICGRKTSAGSSHTTYQCNHLGEVGLTNSVYGGPYLKTVKLENVPVGGVTLKVEAFLQGDAGPHGAPVALSYSSARVYGPPAVTIAANDKGEDFRITVQPCAQAECHEWVRATRLDGALELPIEISP